MGFLHDWYREAYESWTGLDLDHPLHYYAGFGNLEDILKLLPKIKSKEININGYNKRGALALPGCFSDAQFSENIERRFEIGILFLELGAKPHLPNLQDKGTIVHHSIKKRNFGTLRLLLWYDPEHENIIDKDNITAAQKLNEKGIEEFKKITEETAKDARAVKQLLAEAEGLKGKLDFLKAIEKYNQSIVIFKKHGEIEKTLVYPAIYEQSRPILINFYRKKVFEYSQQIEACYAELNHTPEIKKAHLEILKFLEDEATALKFGSEAIIYARKIAELTIEKKAAVLHQYPAAAVGLSNKEVKNSKTKAETQQTSDVDNEFTHLLVAYKKEKRNLEKPETSNPLLSDSQLRHRLVVPVDPPK